MIAKPMNEYPKRDLTPEHTKRGCEDHGCWNGAPLNTEIEAAYAYVDSVLDTSDYKPNFAWNGWALREAFLAGISHANLPFNAELCGANEQQTKQQE